MFSSRPGNTDLDRSDSPHRFDHVIHEYLGRRSAGRNADVRRILQPFRIELAAVGNQITRDAGLGADFAKPVRIRAIGSAHHQDHVDQLAQVPYRRLSVLCRIADIPDIRALNICKAGQKGRNDVFRVVDRQGGLGDVGHWRICRQIQGLNLFDALNEQHGGGNWPIVPSTSGWPAWPIRISVRPPVMYRFPDCELS